MEHYAAIDVSFGWSSLRGFGLKVGVISQGKFEARIRELVAGEARLERVAEPLVS